MSTVIKLRRDTAANWIENNPVLDVGEPGIETDTRKIKYGDGIHEWTTLLYGTTVFPTTIANATRATNLESGSSNQIPYQINANSTGFLPAPNTNLIKFLQWNGTGFTWSAVAASGLTGGTLPNNITSSNLTSLGTLTGLLVAGNVEAYTIGGTLTTTSQPNITTVGTLTGLNVTGAITSSTVSGTLQTAAQPNITSVGTLTSLTVGPGTITGTLATAYQPNITTVGTLVNLTVTNTISGSIDGNAGSVAAANITGNTLASGVTASSLTSVATLTSLTTSGVITTNSTSQGSSYASGNSLQVTGGVGITGNTFTNGTVTVGSTLTVSTGGLIITLGGASITGNSSVTGTLSVSGTLTVQGSNIRSIAAALAIALS
jgi:hypothetical protein